MTMSSHSLDLDPISPTPKSACEERGRNVVPLKGFYGIPKDGIIICSSVGLQRHIVSSF